jgi:DNA-binding HxlR family transcriptional regulator
MAEFKINDKVFSCPVELSVETIMGKWKARILWNLRNGVKRYSELKRELPSITDKMLANQLRELESDGLIKREIYPVIPPKVEYALTPLGLDIQPILKLMQQWGILFKVN